MRSNDSFRKQSISNAGFIFHVRLPDTFAIRIFERAEESLYPFYKFPEAIRKSIYTTNMIERSNKGLKHKSKVKEQFPNEDALERFVCCYYCDLNRSYFERMQRGFCQASAEILQLFEDRLQAAHKQDVV